MRPGLEWAGSPGVQATEGESGTGRGPQQHVGELCAGGPITQTPTGAPWGRHTEAQRNWNRTLEPPPGPRGDGTQLSTSLLPWSLAMSPNTLSYQTGLHAPGTRCLHLLGLRHMPSRRGRLWTGPNTSWDKKAQQTQWESAKRRVGSAQEQKTPGTSSRQWGQQKPGLS